MVKAEVGQPEWHLPDEPVPVRLMNTVSGGRGGVQDDLSTPEQLSGWLVATGLAVGRVTTQDVTAFRNLRDALRRLAAMSTQDPRPYAASPLVDVDEAVRVVNGAAAGSSSSLRLRRDATGLRRDDAPDGATAALATVATRSVELLTGSDASVLRACQAPGCTFYYVRHNPRRSWCSNECGNRARVARHYQRHRATSGTRSPV